MSSEPGAIRSNRRIFGSHRIFTGTAARSVILSACNPRIMVLLNCVCTVAGRNEIRAAPPAGGGAGGAAGAAGAVPGDTGSGTAALGAGGGGAPVGGGSAGALCGWEAGAALEPGAVNPAGVGAAALGAGGVEPAGVACSSPRGP